MLEIQVRYRVYSDGINESPFFSLCGQLLRIFLGHAVAREPIRTRNRVNLMLPALMPLPVESGGTETNRSADI